MHEAPQVAPAPEWSEVTVYGAGLVCGENDVVVRLEVQADGPVTPPESGIKE